MSRRVVVLGLARALKEAGGPATAPRQQQHPLFAPPPPPQQRKKQLASQQQPQPQPQQEKKKKKNVVVEDEAPWEPQRYFSRLLGDFWEPGRVVGKGGFSKVIAARHRIDDETYAIKVTRGEAVAEVRALSKVGPHENVVRYHNCWYDRHVDTDSDSEDDDELDGPVLCIQMELCEETLREWLKRQPSREQLKAAAREAARGLRHVHSRSYAHLDVAAANIFRRRDGTWCLGDFGLSRPASDVVTTQHGHALYMAPERRENDVPPYDLRKSDVFSLAVVFFELANVFPTDMERALSLQSISSSLVEQPHSCRPILDDPTFSAMLHTTPEARPHLDHVVAKLS
mmetsp:Transcript_25969/g.79915  ORF Transcript_25969/g.79915 Transcript_25969/m.79915 type:complete len:342 (+) Transcript_25969:76-1101(+)